MGSGCDELGSVGDVHHVRGLQGEGGGALPGHGDMGLSVLWVVIIYWVYLGRVMVICCLGMMRTTGGCAAELGLHGVG